MKILSNIILLLLVANFSAFSQVEYCDKTISQSPPSNSYGGYFANTCICIFPQTSDILYNQTGGNYEYISRVIHIKPTLDAYSFYANISDPNSLYFSSGGNLIINASNNSIEKDHLLEISFSDNQLSDIHSRINEFLNNTNVVYKPSYEHSSNYFISFNNGAIINPYDPDHISVDCVFWRPGATSGIIRYGFFYKGFEENNNIWSEKSNYDNWRIRFSPDTIGHWNYYVNIWVGNKLMQTSDIKSFDVIKTDDPGFVKVANGNGENKQYLKYANNNEVFIPIGNNYAWTSDRSPNSLYELEDAMNNLAGDNNEGGNATRFILSPWSFHVEREKLNNYDNCQPDMIAIDKYINYLQSKKMYITLGIILQDEFHDFNDSDHATTDWRINPYHMPQANTNDPYAQYKGIKDVDRVDQFYSNTYAQNIFKKRLRYINARWGYSKNMMLYELHSEIDNTDFFHDQNNPTISESDAFKVWYDNMAGYLKNQLGCKQLISVSYGRGEVENWSKLELWKDPLIDIILPHIYYGRETAVGLTTIQLNTISTYLGILNKPIFIEECNVNPYRDEVQFCTDLEYHKRNWAYNFVGACGVLFWDFAFLNPDRNIKWGVTSNEFNNNITNNTKLYNFEYYKNIPGIRNFFFNNNLNLLTKKYSHIHNYGPDVINNPWYELAYSISEDKTTMFGWFRNRSSNFYNCDDCLNTFAVNSTSFTTNNISGIWGFDCSLQPTRNNQFWYNNWPVTNSYTESIIINGESINVPKIYCDGGILPTSDLNPGDANYNKAFHDANYPNTFWAGYPNSMMLDNKHIGNLMVGKDIQTITISGLTNNDHYKIQWYWTWKDVSEINVITPPGSKLINSSFQVNNLDLIVQNEMLTFLAPPTILSLGKTYPGDWAFIINKLTNETDGLTKSSDAKEPIINKIPIFINISPNPTNGIINITSTELNQPYSFQLFDTKGILILSRYNIYSTDLKLDISNQSKGVYYLRVLNSENSQSFKIIKL